MHLGLCGVYIPPFNAKIERVSCTVRIRSERLLFIHHYFSVLNGNGSKIEAFMLVAISAV